MTPYPCDGCVNSITNTKHTQPSWWFVKIRLKFCLFVLLVLPCIACSPSPISSIPSSSSSSSSLSPSSSDTVFFLQKQPNIRLQKRPIFSDSIRTSPIWTSLPISVPNNHTQDALFHYDSVNISTFNNDRSTNDFQNQTVEESTLFRRGREAHRTFMERIAPHRIAPPPVPKLPPSRTHILQKRPHIHFHEHPHILKHQTLTGAASITSLSSSDLGLPDNIANEYIDGVNPPKFLGRPETDVFDHHDDEIRKTHKDTTNKKKHKHYSTPIQKVNPVFILPNSQPEVPLVRPILPPDNNNYAPSPVRSTNDSINSILHHIRSKQKTQDVKHHLNQHEPHHHHNKIAHHHNHQQKPQQNTEQANVHVGMSNGEFRPSSLSHPTVEMTPPVSVSPVNVNPATEPQKSSSDLHSSMKLDLSLMLKQEFDAKNAELNRTSLFTIDDSALDHFRLVGHVPSSTSQATATRPDRDRLFYSGSTRVRLPPANVVVKKTTKRPTVKPTFRPVNNKKSESKNYHRIKPQRRPTGSVPTTAAPTTTTTEESVPNLSHAPATTNVRWEPPKDISLPTAPGSTVATDIRSTTSTGSPINEFELTFNDVDLNVDESRNDMGTNHSKIDWFATFDTGRRRRVNLGANDTLATSIHGSGSAPFRLTTERLAYILIGSCCGLSLLCLIVVAMSVRCRDVCDDYRSWKSTDKRWQQRRLRPGVFVRPPGPQSFFPYPTTLLRATGVLPRYLRAAVMGDKPKLGEQNNPANNMNNSPNGQCCHCVNCSSTWFFRDVKQGDWCCQRGYLEPPKRNKLPFGAASTVNTFMATKDNEFPVLDEHETRPKRLMVQDDDTEEDEDFDEQPEDDEGDEIATDFSNLFDSHHHMHMHYNHSSGANSNNDHMSPGRNKLKPSQLEPFECSQHEQMRHKSDENKSQEWGKSGRMEKSQRKNAARREAENASNARTRFAVPKQLNVRRQQQQKHGITKVSSSHHRPRFKVTHKPEPNIVSFLHPPQVGPYERPVLHHHFDPIVGPMVFTGRYPDLGPPPPTAATAAHLHHLRAAHPGSMHPPNVSVIWNSNDSERLI